MRRRRSIWLLCPAPVKTALDVKTSECGVRSRKQEGTCNSGRRPRAAYRDTSHCPRVAEYLVGYDPRLNETNMGAALSQELARATWIVTAFNVVYAILGILVLYLGIKILRMKRFPPLGLAVPFRMRVRTGVEALILGAIYCIVGAVFLFHAVAFIWYWPWKVL